MHDSFEVTCGEDGGNLEKIIRQDLIITYGACKDGHERMHCEINSALSVDEACEKLYCAAMGLLETHKQIKNKGN